MLSRLKAMLPPGMKQWVRQRGNSVSVSTDYKPLNDTNEIAALQDAWQDPSLPQAQRLLADKQIADMRRGNAPSVYRVLADAVQTTGAAHGKVIEVGCSSGYYWEVLEFFLNHAVDYTGIDYSPSFIAMARSYYPGADFQVGNAANLPLPDRSCDILISGCVLLHVPDYQKAIKESARVSRQWVIFHRTPLAGDGATHLYEKKAYGVRCMELSFSEDELRLDFAQAGLSVVQEFLIEENLKTYLCRRKAVELV